MENRNTRGSEWHKWDLHIHTPFTGKNDQFSGHTNDEKWNNYLTKIEENDDVKVLGITDYFSLDNYLYMLDKQKQGRIPNVYLIPNIKLRILPVTKTETPINIHVLFDPSLSIDIIKRDFFNRLSFEFSGSKYACTKTDLIQLGKSIKSDANRIFLLFQERRFVLFSMKMKRNYEF